MVQLIDSDELSLTPGPLSFDEPFYTIHMRAPDPLPAERIAAILRALPGVRELSPPEPKWNHAVFEWRGGEFHIRIAMTFFEATDPPEWAGSPLDLRCLPEHLLTIWEGVRRELPNVWVQDLSDLRLYSPRSFVDELAPEFGEYVPRHSAESKLPEKTV
jgi:hypothetical protein